MFAAYEIHFSTYELAEGETITISFPVGEEVADEGDKLLVHHGHDVAGQNYEAFEPTLHEGRVEVTVLSLSPFALHAASADSGQTDTDDTDDTEGSGSSDSTSSGSVPATGDSANTQILLTMLLLMVLGSVMLIGSRRYRKAHSSYKPIHQRRMS
jgi:LPXTG-motif cell wall-anchored protein